MLKSFNTKERKFMLLEHLNQKNESGKDEGPEYISFKLPITKITRDFEKSLKDFYLKNKFSPKISVATINDTFRLEYLYNRAWLTASLPFRKITSDVFISLIKDPFCHILIARVFGADAGFIIVDFEGKNKEYGVIAGLGILPRFQRRRIATSLAIMAWNLFFKNIVKEIRCEVYRSNFKSLCFVKSLGFEECDKKIFKLEDTKEVEEII